MSLAGDPRIKDSQHDADAIGWAAFFRQDAVVHILEARVAGAPRTQAPPA